MPDLAHDLHRLVALMDRRAESLLAEAGTGLTFRRFLTLVHVAELDGPTQRDLATGMGSTEAATSRMVAGLAREGLLQVRPAGGNRRELRLTTDGSARLRLAGEVLGDRFTALVRGQGLDPGELHATVRKLVTALQEASS
ncbi:MAG: MarR family winged helix-turn-helix transcriptional regulator [Dermatophilaceae bacterium]